MRIEVLFVPRCPNYAPALVRLREALAAESLAPEIEEVPINSLEDAVAWAFPGSPTIRIDGNDVEPDESNAPRLACRLYANRTGLPSEEVLRRALARAKGPE